MFQYSSQYYRAATAHDGLANIPDLGAAILEQSIHKLLGPVNSLEYRSGGSVVLVGQFVEMDLYSLPSIRVFGCLVSLFL
jgi:hypothetical protein